MPPSPPPPRPRRRTEMRTAAVSPEHVDSRRRHRSDGGHRRCVGRGQDTCGGDAASAPVPARCAKWCVCRPCRPFSRPRPRSCLCRCLSAESTVTVSSSSSSFSSLSLSAESKATGSSSSSSSSPPPAVLIITRASLLTWLRAPLTRATFDRALRAAADDADAGIVSFRVRAGGVSEQ